MSFFPEQVLEHSACSMNASIHVHVVLHNEMQCIMHVIVDSSFPSTQGNNMYIHMYTMIQAKGPKHVMFVNCKNINKGINVW